MSYIKRFSSIFIIFLMIFSCGKTVDIPRFNTKKEVGIWVELWNTYDLSKVKEIFLNDNTVTYFSSEKEGLIKGMDAVLDHHEGFGFVEGGKTTGNKLWLEDINTQVHKTSVTVTGIWLFRRSTDPENALPQKGPVTFVYVYSGGGYKIAHVNFGNYEPEEG